MPHKNKDIKLTRLSNYKRESDDHKIEDIITALDFLRKEARSSKNEDIYSLIDSTFTICLHTYCIVKRYEMEDHIGKYN